MLSDINCHDKAQDILDEEVITSCIICDKTIDEQVMRCSTCTMPCHKECMNVDIYEDICMNCTHLENESSSNQDEANETPSVLKQPALEVQSLEHSLIISINKEHHNDNTRPKPLQADENSSPDQPSATVDNGRNQIETTNVGSCSTKHVKDVKQSDLR